MCVSVFSLAVDLETGVAGSKELHRLARSCESGVDVCLVGLGAHLLGRSENAHSELLAQGLIVVGHDVGYVLQVRTLFKGTHKSLFVNNFLAGGVHQSGALGHAGYKVVANAPDSSRKSRDVYGQIVAAGIEFLN